MFQVLRPDIAAMDNNKVFLAACNGQYAVDQITDITSVQPAVFAQSVTGFFRKVEVAGHDAGAAQVDNTALPVAQHFVIIAYLHFEIG